eukprot:COSAG01_NODE_2983_length_6754_cov_3.914651_4_plen_117_part_00
MPISGHYLRGQLFASLLLLSSALMCATFGVGTRLILTPKGCHRWLQPNVSFLALRYSSCSYILQMSQTLVQIFVHSASDLHLWRSLSTILWLLQILIATTWGQILGPMIQAAAATR